MTHDNERLTRAENLLIGIATQLASVDANQKRTAEILTEVSSNLKDVTKENHHLNNAFIEFKTKVMTVGTFLTLAAGSISYLINFILKKAQ